VEKDSLPRDPDAAKLECVADEPGLASCVGHESGTRDDLPQPPCVTTRVMGILIKYLTCYEVLR
jgi:hypothetical protein